MKLRRNGFSMFTTLALLATAAVWTSSASAQTTLRWQFRQGDQYDLQVTQNATTSSMVEGQEIKNDMKMTMTGSWKVASVKDGVGEVVQTIDRVTMKMSLPGVDVDYDSDKQGEATGVGKQIGASLEGLIGAKFTMEMTPRGKVEKASLDEAAQKKLEANPALKLAGGILSDKMLRQMAEQMSSVFPEKPVAKGDTWENESSLELPMLGTAKVHGTYTYEGTADRDAMTLDKIGYQAKWELGDAKVGGLPVKFKDQTLEGVIYFDNAAGRFVESSITQKMTLELSLAGKTINQSISTESITKLTPAK